MNDLRRAAFLRNPATAPQSSPLRGDESKISTSLLASQRESGFSSNVLSITNGIAGMLFAGIYSVVVFLIVVNLLSINKRLAFLGIRNKWLAFVGLLFTFGYIKHAIGYYTSLYPGYCKQTGVCEKLAKQEHASYYEKIKAIVGFGENIWLESVGEGIVYILVGVPLFLFVSPQLLAAFLTGVSAHLISGYSGINASFCRTSCSINPLYL